MTNQNPLVSFIVLTSLLLFCVVGTSRANEIAPKSKAPPSKISIGPLGQVAQDAIIITTSEVSHAKAFMGSILKLKSLGNSNGEPGDEVLQCVGGLTSAMNNVHGELSKMEDSWPSFFKGTTSLENLVDVVLSFNPICERGLRDIDGTIKVMVLRKIEDIVLLTNNVIFRVAKLQSDGKVTRKP